jgi:DNA polymerase I-like protein with 3'-5' exonuclease and polymerase domains
VAYKFKERGYVKSVLGRRYRLMDERKAYMGLSRILQGGNADVTKTALVEADKIRGVTLLNTVHDSILFQPHHTDAVKLVIEAMTDYVNEKFQLRAPLTVEVKSGSNWGAMK